MPAGSGSSVESPLRIEEVEKAFQYVFAVSFPNGGVPVAVKVLHGSTCNDICQVTVRASPTKPSPLKRSHTASLEADTPAHPNHAITDTSEQEDTNSANRTDSADSTEYFLKSSRGVKRAEVLLEAGGLALLHAAGLPVPPVLLAGEIGGETAYLVEPFLNTGRGSIPRRHCARDEAAAGRALAYLHQVRSPTGLFGCRQVAASLNVGNVEVPAILRDCFREATASAGDAARSPTVPSTKATAAAAKGYTGTFVWHASWPELYIQHLLQPQVTHAQRRGLWSARRQKLFETFQDRFRAHFATRAAVAAGDEEDSAEAPASLSTERTDASPPARAPQQAEGNGTTTKARNAATPLPLTVPDCSLLHGDIWGGNLMFDGHTGQPFFIDPQPLYGDREMDLAMTQLFGGFGDKFYDAYEAIYPLVEEAEMRVPWYQLYYLLMHLNLFGESYGGATEEALRSI